jgi:uncharacterized membrane protein
VRTGSQLTLGERSADKMRSFMGSWGFVFGALLFLGGWMLGNGGHGFDPYPFILLNLVLSCLAAMQGAILLIAAKRSDQISAELALHDYQTNLDADKVIKAVHQLTSEIHAHIIGGDAKPGATPNPAPRATTKAVPPARSGRATKSPSE